MLIFILKEFKKCSPLVLFSSDNDIIIDPDVLVNANSFSADGFDKGVVSTGWPGDI